MGVIALGQSLAMKWGVLVCVTLHIAFLLSSAAHEVAMSLFTSP